MGASLGAEALSIAFIRGLAVELVVNSVSRLSMEEMFAKVGASSAPRRGVIAFGSCSKDGREALIVHKNLFVALSPPFLDGILDGESITNVHATSLQGHIVSVREGASRHWVLPSPCSMEVDGLVVPTPIANRCV